MSYELNLGQTDFLIFETRTVTSLPQHWNDALHTSSCWETDAVIKHVTDIEISCKKN